MIATGFGQVLAPSVMITFAGYGLLRAASWLQEFRYLQRTTPEERVLEEN